MLDPEEGGMHADLISRNVTLQMQCPRAENQTLGESSYFNACLLLVKAVRSFEEKLASAYQAHAYIPWDSCTIGRPKWFSILP